MKPATRLIAAGVALILVAASCGAPTGEAPTAATTGPTAAPATPAAPPAPKLLTLVVDTVRGTAGVTDDEKKPENPASLVCVVMSKFPQGSRGWRRNTWRIIWAWARASRAGRNVLRCG